MTIKFTSLQIRSRALLVAAVALLGASVALAGEAAPGAEASEPSVVDWSGFFLGGNFGVGVPTHRGARFEALSGLPSSTFDLYAPSNDRAGATFGAQAGYNWQKGRLVWGVETEFNFLDGRHGPSGTFPAPPAYLANGVTMFTLSQQPNALFFGSLRGRLGYALDRALIYVAGGVASGGAAGPATLTFYGPGGAGSVLTADYSQSSRMKYILGAGVEYSLGAPWSARLEYSFLNQSLNSHFFNADDMWLVSRRRNETHLLRLGLNYRFDQAAGEAAAGGDEKAKSDEQKGLDNFSVHGQSTAVYQAYPKFPARYDGPNSFRSKGQARFGSTTGLFAGAKLWQGAAAFINPEIDQGYGAANSTGAGAYPDVAVPKVGRAAPYLRFQRYFVRQIIGLDGGAPGHDPDEGSASETLESAQNQLAGKVDRDRLIFTVGKFAVGDVFDDNVYAHDPTTGFLNLAFNGHGAFDYAADAWGYTHGAAAEWKQDWWTLRAGGFQLSRIPNGNEIEPALLRQYMGVAEAEARYDLFEQPGAIKFLAFGDNGYFSNPDEALRYAALTGNTPPTVDMLRRRRLKTGAGVNVKQQIIQDFGVFLRASLADGRRETVDNTDIDRSLSFGFVAGGALWDRPKDEIGGAMGVNGLAPGRVRFFSAGGTSVYIGDGAMSYAPEKNLEAYYKLGLREGLDATFDYQLFVNPAYNADRGPVNMFALRLHAQF